jgi:hypothetical protein
MRSRYLVRFALLASLWAGIAAAPTVQPARAQGTPYPANVNATMARILATARKSWHADAIITGVEMKWYPTDNLDAPGVMHWLEIQVNSPSTSARRYFYVGKPYDVRWQTSRPTMTAALSTMPFPPASNSICQRPSRTCAMWD